MKRTMSSIGGSYAFGPFVLDVSERQLFRSGKEIPLTPKTFETLRTLVMHGGHVLSKQDLLSAVWPDTVVEENNLSQHISLLRKLLHQDDGQEFIATVPKLGYRFTAEVRELTAEPRSPVVSIDPERPPETRYARNGDVNIAYQLLGDGPIDLVFVMGWVSHLEYFWKEPYFARFLRRLASFSRLILFDKRGTGLSDRVPISHLPTLEERMADVRAVLDAANSPRAVLCGVSEGGPMSAVFAATYPEMTLALVMFGTYARRLRAEGYPWGVSHEEHHAFLREIEASWGGPVGLDTRAPSLAGDAAFREWWATYLRMSASPGAAVAMTTMNAQIDVRNVLPSVRVPALVLHRTGDMCLRVEEGRYVASRIPGARFVELPGIDHLPFVGDQEAIIEEIEKFLNSLTIQPGQDRVLATVLLLTKRSHSLPEVWEQFETCVQREVQWFGGSTLVKPSLAASFDGPARALRCAAVLLAHASRMDLRVGIGVHTGECDRLPDGSLQGFAVDIAMQVAKHAGPGEALVSSTVRDLVAGSPFRFDYRTTLSSRSDFGDLRLFKVQGAAPAIIRSVAT